jgi:hypothetical protein
VVAGRRGEPGIPRADDAYNAAPKFALREDAHVEGSVDTKVIGATAEGFGKVGMPGRVRIGNFARGEGDLGSVGGMAGGWVDCVEG